MHKCQWLSLAAMLCLAPTIAIAGYISDRQRAQSSQDKLPESVVNAVAIGNLKAVAGSSGLAHSNAHHAFHKGAVARLKRVRR